MGNGQMSVIRFELPFDADPLLQAAGVVGLPSVVRRTAASYTMDVTLVDTEDARLLREGVVIAHRVVEGNGDWYFSASGWLPHLPGEYLEPVDSQGKLPKKFSSWVAPILRRAGVAPFVGLGCQRQEWALRDTQGQVVAHVRDQKVTLRRDGEVLGQYRELTLTPLEGLTELQKGFLIDSIEAAEGVVVERFPDLSRRLGPPATGLTNFPLTTKISKKARLEEFVAECFKKHLRALIEADLQRRVEAAEPDLGEINALLWDFLRDLHGLTAFLDPKWREDIEELLRGLPFTQVSELEPALIAVIDALVGAVRAPRLGHDSPKIARDVISQRAACALAILSDRCSTLRSDDPDEKWVGALKAAEHLDSLMAVGLPVLPKKVHKLAVLCEEILADLVEVRAMPQEPELDGMSPRQAFDLGRRTQRRASEVGSWRESFITSWPGRMRSADKAITKATKI